jgi:hypothetical protein
LDGNGNETEALQFIGSLYWSNERYNLPNRKGMDAPIGLWMPFWEVRIPLLEGAQNVTQIRFAGYRLGCAV